MGVLIIGKGGREHAIGWKLANEDNLVLFDPGNGMTLNVGHNLEVPPDQLEFSNKASLVVIGPEAPIVEGLGDRLREKGFRVLAPSAEAAKLEGSKVWAKEFMKRHRVPTADFKVVSSADELINAVSEFPVVVKVDGLAAGKGSFVVKSEDELREVATRIFVERRFGDSGERVVVEEFLPGEEFSLIGLLNVSEGKIGQAVFPLSRDYKRRNDGNEGPNTGGMGVVFPVGEEFFNEAMRVWRATVEGIAEEGLDYRGVLYIGLMRYDGEFYVLEYNVRFGDPETQGLMVGVDEDVGEIMKEVAEGTYIGDTVFSAKEKTVGVVLASPKYPDGGEERTSVELGEEEGVVVFGAGVLREKGKLYARGGRILTVVGKGKSFSDARAKVYSRISSYRLGNGEFYYRKDIGKEVS